MTRLMSVIARGGGGWGHGYAERAAESGQGQAGPRWSANTCGKRKYFYILKNLVTCSCSNLQQIKLKISLESTIIFRPTYNNVHCNNILYKTNKS